LSAKAGSRQSRIFIVDDHPLFRHGLRHMLETIPGLIVCGEAADAGQALAGLARANADLVLVDISLGRDNGLDLIKDLKTRHPRLPSLVISMHDEGVYAERALRAGAVGYVMKDEPPDTVRDAIQKALDGQVSLSEKASASMLSSLVGGGKESSANPVEKLSNRELDVFRLFGEGKTARQIAREMGLSVATINSFRARIKVKLKLASASELTIAAVEWASRHALR
jgi:DNA-binding NarL/FixJ family response regulator